MRQTIVVDTSVIIYDPYFIEHFENSNIIIQIHVLNELDKLKKMPFDKGKNARTFIRLLDELCVSGNINKGIKIPTISSVVKVDTNIDDILRFGDSTYTDNKILACAFRLKESNRLKVTLVSRDINMRVRASAFGINAENYKKEDSDKNDKRIDKLYSGIAKIKHDTLSNDLNSYRKLSCDGYAEFNNILPNECVYISNDSSGNVALGRKIKNNICIIKNKSLWGISPRNKEQAFAIDLLMDSSVSLVSLIGRAGTGKTLIAIAAGLEQLINKKQYEKLFIFRPIQPIGSELGFLPGPQPLDANILTPNGWVKMGNIKIGQDIITRDGSPSKVLNIYKKGIKPVYRLTTTDNRSTECCLDHLWFTYSSDDNGSVKSTLNIKETLTKYGKYNHTLPHHSPINFEYKKLNTSSYIIGLLLARKSSNTIKISDRYKYKTSIKDRLLLLRGLMDAGGYISIDNKTIFETKSISLANDLSEICFSLGGKANIENINNKYIVFIEIPHFNPFKNYLFKNEYNSKITDSKIKSIEYIGDKEVQCILIDNPEHLYITDEYIVTHNTIEDKLSPWMDAIVDSFDVLTSKYDITGYKSKKKKKTGDDPISKDFWRKSWKDKLGQYSDAIYLEPITYLRGRSIPNSYIILEEAQNITPDQVKTVLTRAGDYTKIVLTGDIEQTDNSNLDAINNGLTHVASAFRHSELAGHITLTKGERSALATEASKIL